MYGALQRARMPTQSSKQQSSGQALRDRAFFFFFFVMACVFLFVFFPTLSSASLSKYLSLPVINRPQCLIVFSLTGKECGSAEE